MNIEQMAREAGLERDGTRWFSDSGDPLAAQDVEHAALERFAALVRAQALEDAARVCDDKERRKWEILTGGGKLTGFGPLDCAFAIRALAAPSTSPALP